MPKTRPPYPAEFRQQIIELAQAGQSPAELSREFGPTIQTILSLEVEKQADKPGNLSTFYRWQNPLWKSQTVAIR